jgi:spore coat protein CotH
MGLRGHVNPNTLHTGLPLIKITTKGKRRITSKEKYLAAAIEIVDPLNPDNDLSSGVEIRGRGNTTWKHVKKPYRLKFLEKQSMFGLTKAKSWVLLANYQDPTLIMNTVTFELGKRLGFPLANHYIHADLVLNGVYEGSYVITEQVQVGKGRVDIDEDKGFLVELDSGYDEDPKFRTKILGFPVMIKSPEDLSAPSGYDFVKDALNELEAALFDEKFPENGYRDLIDLDILADYILINEIVKNVDIQIPKSVYMYKDSKKGTKIKMGPLWDFDYGFNFINLDSNLNDEYFGNAEEMYINTTFRNGSGKKFFDRFFEDPVFRSLYKERWNRRYQDIAGMETFIDEMAALLSESQKADFAVWHWWRKRIYSQEIENMKAWWRKRLIYLNEEINKL